MITFDEILPSVQRLIRQYCDLFESCQTLIVNRDLNGKVRFILPLSFEDLLSTDNELNKKFFEFLSTAECMLAPHCWPVEQLVLFEQDIEQITWGAQAFSINTDCKNLTVKVADRLASSANWDEISSVNINTPRIVFFSIKGGVGRSSALAATAWHLAEKGRRVLIVDLDLESPGLSSAILSTEKQPTYGITDWLVEDLVDHGDALLRNMIATSDLSRDGQIYVVPAHGAEPGDYIAKLGRVWMPKINKEGQHESWASRLERLQIVAALVPEQNKLPYLQALQDSSYNLFAATQYDEVPAGEPIVEQWHFELSDPDAPHYPWIVYWHSSFAGLNTLYGRLTEINVDMIKAVFGRLIQGVENSLNKGQSDV
mgnify:CR=1 FL=1